MKGRLVIVFGVGLSIALAATLMRPQLAKACGGCFSPEDQVARVESHRMIIRLGTEGTTLWDQIIYTGNAEDFVWVLPVPNENVVIDTADPSFFDYIEDGSRPAVQPLNPFWDDGCWGGGGGGGGGTGFGCSANEYAADGSGGDGDGDGDAPEDAVEIFEQKVVGPYETVVLGADDPQALSAWLIDNGYNVTEESQPAIDHYVAEGSAFVVLRLAPGEDVNSMQPVRISYDGFMGRFPLKMVAVGARGILDLSLWVIAEQRYEVPNYGTVEIDPADLVWDFATNKSNYNDVFDATAVANGNRAWIAEYAAVFSDLSRRGIMAAPPDGAIEDIAVATAANATPFITRLRARVLVEHINEDLILAPADDARPIAGLLFAEKEVNRPPSNCQTAIEADDGGAACRSANTHKASGTMLMLLIGLMLMRRRLPSFLRRR